MKDRLRNVMIGLLAVAWIGVAAQAQQPGPAPRQEDEAHHRQMMARGADAMGFDQERTIHHFLFCEDGGLIDVSVKETTDHATLQAIRRHLQEIATQFKTGDVGKPALTHAQQVPGTGEIADHRTGDSGVGQPPASHGMMKGPGRGMMGMNLDASAMAQMREVHDLFMNHDRITRTVTNLPNGIRTVTESTDPRVAQLLKDHVTGSDRRVATGDDPQLPIESDALRLIYKNHDMIRTTLEPTDAGIAVVQTSSDPNTVAALQQHAAEVTEFVKEGMPAMHKAMMKNGRGMMGR